MKAGETRPAVERRGGPDFAGGTIETNHRGFATIPSALLEHAQILRESSAASDSRQRLVAESFLAPRGCRLFMHHVSRTGSGIR